MEHLLTVEQAAKRLQAAPYTVRRHLREGRLRGIKRGRDWRVPESALTEGISKANTPPPGSLAPGDSNPLARALAMVEARDQQAGKVTSRIEGVDDVATELRALREDSAT